MKMKNKIIELIKCFIVLLYRRVVLQSHDSTKVDGIYLRMKNLARCPDEARRGWLRDAAPEFAYTHIAEDDEIQINIVLASAEQVAREILCLVNLEDPEDRYAASLSGCGFDDLDPKDITVERVASALREGGYPYVTWNYSGEPAMDIARL